MTALIKSRSRSEADQGRKSGRGKGLSMFRLLALLLGLAMLSACSALAARLGQSPNEPPPASPASAHTSTSQPASSPSSTFTPAPTATATPHPLTIQALRDREYPASEIVIEETLPAGANYHRYLVSYTSEGLRIYALLTIPYGDPPDNGWPAIVFNHGYIPPDIYRTTERYVAYVDAFARNGYVVIKPDYRGHGDSQGRARGGYGSPDYTIDVLHALSALRNHPLTNPDRIGMWGHSMGGYITLRSMVVREEIRAGVIWAGVVASYPDLLDRWSRRRDEPGPTRTPRPGSWRLSLIELYGSPLANPAFWDSLSSNSYLADLSGPLQLHHGTADDSVPLEFSQSLLQQVQAVGGQAELFEYPGDNHNISAYFSLAMQRSIDFFDLHLKGES